MEATARLEAGDRLDGIEEEVLDVRAAAERAELRVRVVLEARDVLRGRAAGLLAEHAGELAGSMQQALNGLIGKAAKVAPGLDGAGTAEAAIRAGDGVSRAWRSLEGFAEKYRLLREAYGVILRGVFEPQLSHRMAVLHAEFENLLTVVPMARRTEERPWPQAPPARLGFVALSDLRPWTPNAEELNAAFERERELVKQQQAEQHAALQARNAAMARAAG